MKGADIVSVLNFSAFRPEPDDSSESWRKRFPVQRSVLLNVGRSVASWRGVQRNGKLTEGDTMSGELKDILGDRSFQIKEIADNGWCAVSLNTRYVISLEANLSRRPGSEEIIKSNPRSVLGARFERGKRYAVTHNPETNSSILIACDEEHIRKIETTLKDAGFQIGRLCCGTYVLLQNALTQTNATRGSDKPASFFYVVCCQGSVCALVQDNDRWSELRSRTDVYEGSAGPIIELLSPFRQRVPQGASIVLICDNPVPQLDESLATLFPESKLVDLTQVDLLWKLLSQN
jgi:uncharacterized protein YaaQ